MRDNIINVLKNSKKALTIYELQDALNLHEVNEVRDLSEELRKMEEEVIIYCSNKGRYMMLEDSHLRKGVLRANKMEVAANNTEGVKNAIVNFMMLKMNGEFEDGVQPKEVMARVLENCKKVEDDCEIFF